MISIKVNGKILNDIDLIIFDKDGTLFQLYPYCSRMVMERTDAICSTIGNYDPSLRNWMIERMGVDLKNHRIFPEGPIGVFSKYYAQDMIYTELKNLGYEIDLDAVHQAFMRADDRINNPSYLKETMVPVNGMIDFVKGINGKCKLAIFSNDMTGRLHIILNLFGIDTYFNYVLGGDMIKLHKPDPMGVIKIMGDLGIKSENTALIGDSKLDIESGKRAKCKYLITMLSDISYIKCSSEIVIRDFGELQIR